MKDKIYDVGNRDIIEQGEHYVVHVDHMTGEALHEKSHIAAELAHRDIEIDRLLKKLEETEEDWEDVFQVARNRCPWCGAVHERGVNTHCPLTIADAKLDALRIKVKRWRTLLDNNYNAINRSGKVVQQARDEVMKECADTVESILSL